MLRKLFGHQPEQDDDYINPFELDRLLRRRQALAKLGILGGGLMGASLLSSCGAAISASSVDATASSGTISGGTTVAACSGVIPTETIGPYPADGSNSGTDALHQSSIYRQNITGGKTGVPLTLILNINDVSESCAPVSNAAVYIWHTDKDGNYSGYGSQLGQTYCRGVQITDANGQVNFTTIYPGWYSGRITHVHFEVFLNNNLSSTSAKISQLGFPQDVTTSVYNSSLYSAHGQNTSVTSFARDGIFSDGTTYQIATVAGSVSAGLVASLNVGI